MDFLRKMFGNKQSDREAEEYFEKANEYILGGNNQVVHWQKAIELLKEAIRLNPKHARAHMLLCVCYGSTLDSDSVRHHYKIMKQLDPNLANQFAQTTIGKQLGLA